MHASVAQRHDMDVTDFNPTLDMTRRALLYEFFWLSFETSHRA